MSAVALCVIVFLVIGLAAVIVILGSLPGKIARQRNHPFADGVAAASWIGLATGVFWPVAFIWAFCPFPRSEQDRESTAPSSGEDEIARLREQLASMEAKVAELQAAGKADA